MNLYDALILISLIICAILVLLGLIIFILVIFIIEVIGGVSCWCLYVKGKVMKVVCRK